MKNPVSAWFRVSKKAGKSTLAAAKKLQKAFAPPSLKAAKRIAKAVLTPLKSEKASKLERRPTPGTFTDGVFAARGRRMHYKLYTPVGSARRKMPLVVMLHGCTQSAADFASTTSMNTLADELGFLVLYPQQSRAANMNLCWNWYSPGHQARGYGEPACIASLTRVVARICNADDARIYIAGFSAGAAASAIIGSAYPELFVAVGVHSGVAKGDIEGLNAALTAMRKGHGPRKVSGAKPVPMLPTILFHGDDDKIVHPKNAEDFVDHLGGAHPTPLRRTEEKGATALGRSFTRAIFQDANNDVLMESWTIHGAGHAWSGGGAFATYTDPLGPSASREFMRFFLERKRAAK